MGQKGGWRWNREAASECLAFGLPLCSLLSRAQPPSRRHRAKLVEIVEGGVAVGAAAKED